jgi:hypothetical protein
VSHARQRACQLGPAARMPRRNDGQGGEEDQPL